MSTTGLVAPMRVGGRAARQLSGLLRSPSGVIGAVLILGALILVVLSVTRVLPDPIAQHPSVALQGPSAAHPLGTDRFGRDLLSRSAAGLANSALVAIVAVAFATVLGTLGGLVAGFVRRIPDRVIGAVTNILFAFPPLLLALSLA